MGKEKRSTGKRECVRDMLAVNPSQGGSMIQERLDADTDASCSILSQPRPDCYTLWLLSHFLAPDPRISGDMFGPSCTIS